MQTKQDLEEMLSIIVKSMAYAKKCHEETNHKYDKDKPYEVHLKMVYTYAGKYKKLVSPELYKYILGACWTHDTIEDTRQTYNNVKDACGEIIAEITYAVTNEKGKTRKERANDKYYEGIRNTPGATFVKMCDRLANVKYSVENNSSMKDKYKKEYPDFKKNLYLSEYKPMFDELEQLLGIK
jgi:(p)ppGpp synthase/HD superfamily hydrolase